MLLLVPAALTTVFAFVGLGDFRISMPIRLFLSALPLVATWMFGLFGLLPAVAVVVSLFIRSS